MPNYHYNTPDSMRRGGCSRQAQPQMNRMAQPQTNSCPRPAQSQTNCAAQPQTASCSRPVCDDDRAMRDELRSMPLAMAYVPWQQWCDIYEAEKGFSRGTIFCELDKPFKGIGGCCR